MSSLKALVLLRQDGVKRLRRTGEAGVVATHLVDADSVEAMMVVVEDVVVVVAEEVAQEPASNATRKVTWLVIALMRTRDLQGDPWNASSAMKMVIWPVNAQLVTVVVVVAVVVTTTTRDHAVMQMMEAIPGLRTEEETTMATIAEVVEAVAGVELPTMTWTMPGVRPTTTMLLMIGAVTVVIKVVG